jgi:glycosyltransferase involved in cell wall biosynthesis
VSKINILEIIETGGIGGAEMVLYNTVRFLDKERFSVRVLIVGRGILIDRLRELDIPVYVFEFKKSYNLEFLTLVRSLIMTHGIDIVHTHMSRMNMYGCLGSLFTPARNVMTIHGLSEFSGLRARLYYTVFGNLSGKITAVSSNLARRFVQKTMVGEKKVVAVPNGVDLDRFAGDVDRARVLARFRIDPASKVILAVGNIRRIKGYEFLFEVFDRIAESDKDLVLLICGNDMFHYKKKLLPLLHSKDLARRVVFAEFVDDIEQVYKASDMYVLTSLTEGFSLTTIEAMASGLPVVTTDCVGPRDIIENGVDGLIVEKRDPDLFCKAVVNLLNDPDRSRAMGEAARKKAARDFSVRRSVQRIQDVFLSLVQNQTAEGVVH